MNSTSVEFLEFFDEDDFFDSEPKSKVKTIKRKWREIEIIKENRRLKKYLEALDKYYFEH
jgi:hypothetical protein